jgi:hypothetical protein
VKRPIVELLTTGGTIATIRAGSVGSHPALDPADLSAAIGDERVELRTRELARVPSWTMDPSTMMRIAIAARDAALDQDVTGVVLTHGTTTLEFTAFLIYLVHRGTTPIVITGAMRRADDPDSDGPRNLRSAVRVASSEEARGLGPLVVFGDRVLASRTAWKAHRTAFDAFEDLNGDVGRVAADTLAVLRRPAPGPGLSGKIDSAVAFVKAVPGMNGQLVEERMPMASSSRRSRVSEAYRRRCWRPLQLRLARCRSWWLLARHSTVLQLIRRAGRANPWPGWICFPPVDCPPKRRGCCSWPRSGRPAALVPRSHCSGRSQRQTEMSGTDVRWPT